LASQLVNIRNLFLPNKENHVFVDSDWSSVENRVGAILAGEQWVLDAFDRGEDLYKKVYGQMFEVEDLKLITKAQRQVGKALVLGQNYGMSKWGLSKWLDCSHDEAQGYIEQYANAHPATQKAKGSLLGLARKTGKVTTYFGRVRHIENLNSSEGGERRAAEREVWNTNVQGTSADILKICIVRFEKIIKERGLPVELVMPIHDEILCQADVMNCDIWDVRDALLEAMQIKLCGKTLPAEEEFGWRFGTLTDYETLIKNAPNEKLADKLSQSRYFKWKEEEAVRKQQAEKESQEEQNKPPVEEKLPPNIEVPDTIKNNAGENLKTIENDFQTPAINVEVEDNLELPITFAVDMAKYRSNAGYYLYFTLCGAGKKTLKYMHRVTEDSIPFFKKMKGAKVTIIR